MYIWATGLRLKDISGTKSFWQSLHRMSRTTWYMGMMFGTSCTLRAPRAGPKGLYELMRVI